MSIKALHFHDKKGLLKPVSISTNATSFLGCTASRLSCNRFSLEEIDQPLAGNLSAQQRRGMLKLRQSLAIWKIQEEAIGLKRVVVWLKMIYR